MRGDSPKTEILKNAILLLKSAFFAPFRASYHFFCFYVGHTTNVCIFAENQNAYNYVFTLNENGWSRALAQP